ncbi:MAG TPA: hypothetical protein VLA41_00830 [Burkholderiales bacterium]|nr:hypothetical protein [Burkholderiales bacterium]
MRRAVDVLVVGLGPAGSSAAAAAARAACDETHRAGWIAFDEYYAAEPQINEPGRLER